MLNRKTNPVGVDLVIDKFQTDLYNELTKNVNWAGYESYHRVYRNEKGGDTLPEAYTTKGNYKEVLFDDRKSVSSFFLTEERRTYDNATGYYTQDLSVVFQGKLDKLYPSIVTRADEEMIQEIIFAIDRSYWRNRLKEVVTGIDNVYESLKLSTDKKHTDDMSNYSLCRFNFEITYTIFTQGSTLCDYKLAP